MAPRWRDTWNSRRLQACSYRDPGDYFVTLCTRKRDSLFGEIETGVVNLSPAGKLVHAVWQNLPSHFPHLALDIFVVMPNHLHGILIYKSQGPPLGTVIGAFKSEVSRRLQRSIWQRYYYDHVIRNKTALDRIRAYIAKNPLCWADDEENPRRW